MIRRFCLLAILLAAACGENAAAAVDMKLTSDGARLWRAAYDTETDSTAITLRDKQHWRPIASSAGSPVAICAGSGRLHAFFTSGKYTQYTTTGASPGNLWPKTYRGRGILAACLREEAGSSPSVYLVLGPAKVVASAQPATSSAPAAKAAPVTTTTPAADETIVLVQRKRQWSLLTTVKAADLDPRGEYHLAAMPDGALYLMVCTADGWPVKFLRFADGQWAPLAPMQWPVSDHRLRWMLAAGQDLMLAGVGDEGVWLRRVDLPGGELADPVSVTYDGDPVKPSDAGRPGMCPLGHTLSILWPRDDAWSLGAVDMRTGATTGVLNVAAPAVDSEKIAPWLRGVYVIVGAVMLIVLIRQARSGMIGPFRLPEGLTAAHWYRRLIAFAIDAIPWVYVAQAVLRIPMTELERMTRRLQEANEPEAPLLFMIALWFGLYLVYAMVMEWRYGATLGKRVMRVRVVGRDGNAPSAGAVVLRNLTKPLEIFTPLVVLFLIWPLFTKYQQRAGDMLAGTAVVNKPRGCEWTSVSHAPSEGEPSDEADDPPAE